MAEVLLVNPRKRRRKTTTRKRKPAARRTARRKTTARRTPARSRRRTYRRNPIGKVNLKSFMRQTLMPSAVGAVGALGIDMILGFLPLPANFKTGPMRPAVKAVGAVAVGMAAGKFASRKIGEQVAAGGLTVVLYDTMKTFLQGQFPALPLGQYDAYPGYSDYPALSYVSPSPTVQSRADQYIPAALNAYPGESLDGFQEDLSGGIGEGFQEDLGAYMHEPDFLY